MKTIMVCMCMVSTVLFYSIPAEALTEEEAAAAKIIKSSRIAITNIQTQDPSASASVGGNRPTDVFHGTKDSQTARAKASWNNFHNKLSSFLI